MSLFFEDEIQKVKSKTDRLGLQNLLSQDPRNHPSWANRKHGDYFRQSLYRRDQSDSKNRGDSWWDND